MFVIFYLDFDDVSRGWVFSSNGNLLLVRNGIDKTLYEQALLTLRETVALMFGAIYSSAKVKLVLR